MAKIIVGKEIINIRLNISIESAIREVGLFPDAFLFLIKGKPVPMTSIVQENDEIECIRIASGG